MKSVQTPLYNKTLIVDLYELTMAAGYYENCHNPLSTFELFVREMPRHRSYLVSAGLQQAVEYLLHLKFNKNDLNYLQELPVFSRVSPDFFDYLANFRFSGEVWAMPEGQIYFPGEPLLRITAPMI